MVENRTAGVSLFELLARGWTFDDEVLQVVFSSDDATVLFRLLSGTLALVPTGDTESPRSRTRIEIDTGRTTIQQRRKPVPAAIFASVKAKSDLPVVRFAKDGFLVIDGSDRPQQITLQGQSVIKTVSGSAVTALCSNYNGESLAIARTSYVSVHNTKDMDILIEINLQRSVSCISFATSGTLIATWGENCLTLIDTLKANDPPKEIHGICNVNQLSWDESGTYIACSSSSAREFHIVDLHAGTFHTVQDYPSPVFTAAFSETGRALVTSGAYRLAGWSTDDLPQKNHPGTPLVSGKPGLITIATVAAHPTRSLVAAGYVNGLVTITSIGTPQEMMVHQETGTSVNHLVWSNTGEHLAIGFKSGKAAVVTFPDQLFKYPAKSTNTGD